MSPATSQAPSPASPSSPARSMREAAAALLRQAGRSGEEPAARLRRPLPDPDLRWLEYRPRSRPGVSLAELDPGARKAAHRLLATGLSPHAYAQAMTVVALEEVLDRREGWRRGRHSGDFWVVVYGDPADPAWAWRFEGHHLSVSMTVTGDEVHPAPVFLGANPAAVRYAGRPVLRPLAIEEDLSRELLAAMDPAARAKAVVAGGAPMDIRSGPSPAAERIEPLGVPGADLGGTARDLLTALTTLYLDRLPEPVAAREAARIDPRALHFAWEGPTAPGARHYYRIQAPDLLIEYDNTTSDANHIHTVLRRPGTEFGGDVLAAHLADAHG